MLPRLTGKNGSLALAKQSPSCITVRRCPAHLARRRPNDTGFWKYRATLRVKIAYEGRWWKHQEEQDIRIADTDSFTGYSWDSSLQFPDNEGGRTSGPP